MSYKRHGSKSTVTDGEGVNRDENVEVPDVKNGNRRFLSFTALTRQIRTTGVKKQSHSDSLCETEAFHQARY